VVKYHGLAPRLLIVRGFWVRSQLNSGTCWVDREMPATDNLPRVDISGDQIDVHYRSAIDDSPCSEAIKAKDIVRIVLERSSDRVHWFLQHRAGWTLHFNDRFENATKVISWLESFAGFSAPPTSDIAGPGSEGTVVWSSALDLGG
jgi:hypothetical protein